jgi:hypothetical protein
MSFSYWLRILTALTLQLLALAFASQLIFGVWSQYEANRNAYRAYQEKAEQDQKKTADDIAKDCEVIPQISPALRDCLRKAILAYQKNDTTNKDLQAQQDMAFWALITAIVGAGGLLISIGGVYLLFQSLRQTRTAITNDREIGEAQVRAYLSVESPEQHSIDIRPNQIFKAELKIKNTGQSPAYNVRYVAALMPLEYPLADTQVDLIGPDPDSIQRGVTIGASAETRIEAELTRALTAQEIVSVKSEGPTRLFAVAIVTYFDIFKREERKTKYCAYLTAGIAIVDPQSRKIGTKHEWALANVHNEAT